MIGFLRGKILYISLSKALLDVGGVGYLIHSTSNFLSKLKIEQETSFWTHTAVRENDISLYGFENEFDLQMFENLLGVSGIGPKSALAIIGVAGVGAIEEAVLTGSADALVKIGGVGKKTAEKIVLELSGKVASKDFRGALKDDIDVFEALQALGYKDNQIKETVREIPKEISGANEKIKYALKMLGK